MQESSNVRVLVFSPNPILSVEMYIDELDSVAMKQYDLGIGKTSPLYIASWDSSKYVDYKHTIRIIATDSEGNKNEISQTFSLNGQTQVAHNSLVLHYLQHTNITKLFIFIFSMLYIYAFIFLIIIPKTLFLCLKCNRQRYEMLGFQAQDFVHYVVFPNSSYVRHLDININFGLTEDENTDVELHDADYVPPVTNQNTKYTSSISRREAIQLWLFKTLNSIKMSIVMHLWSYMHVPMFSTLCNLFFGIYILFGPIIIGPLIAGNNGWMFLWGFEINGQFSPQASHSVLFTTILMVMFWIPSIMLSSIPYGARVIHYQSIETVHSSDQEMKMETSRFSRENIVKVLKKVQLLLLCLSYSGITMTALIIFGWIFAVVFFGKLLGPALLVCPGVFWMATCSCLNIVLTYRNIFIQLKSRK
jgi:hypothetical protein